MSEKGPYHPDQEEEVLPPLPDNIPDEETDRPNPSEILPTLGEGDISPVVLGCAVFGYGIYSNQSFVQGVEPLRVLRYALRSGINAFDTSPWYHPSEIVMGRCLERIKDEFPREKYQLITKVGKYGPKVHHHGYDSASVMTSVKRSLKRLKTDYLDVVYLHDVEFVTRHPYPCPGGDHLSALKSITDPSLPDNFHLRPPYTPLGPGDENILEGLRTLSELRSQGIIRKIGIAGLPLPLLLRLSHLCKSQGIQLDIVQTYAQHTILTPLLGSGYLEEFQKAGVKEITNAAPLAMGILTSSGGPEWHPARSSGDGMYEACREVSEWCEKNEEKIENVALDFGLRELKLDNGKGKGVPVVVGCKSIEEIKRTVEHWRKVNVRGVRSDEEVKKAKEVEDYVGNFFEEKGVRGLAWSSPSQESMS